jgi:hypothetical protein
MTRMPEADFARIQTLLSMRWLVCAMRFFCAGGQPQAAEACLPAAMGFKSPKATYE